MLSDAQRILICADATGDLPAEKRPVVERLLARSDEARGLHSALKADGDTLRQMPRLTAPQNLHDAILGRLPSSATVATATHRKRRDYLSTVAVAAAVFAVCAGSWWAYQISRHDAPVDEPVVHSGPATTDLIVGNKERRPSMPPPRPPESAPAIVAASPSAAVEQPKPNSPAVIVAPTGENRELASPPKTVFETVQVVPPRLPGAFAIRALDQGDVHPRFLSELTRGESHRMDVFCRDAGKALDRFSAILRKRGVAVQVDSLVAEMQKRKVRGAFALYCEDLTPEEWVSVFKTVAASDRRYEDLKPGDGAFDQLVLMPLTTADQKDLSGLLGIDPLASPLKSKPTAADAKPADAASQTPAKSDAPRTAKSAISLAVQPMRSSPGASKEIKQFVESRRDRPGAVAAVLYFRLSN